jgi:hypothetical protein
LIANSNKETKVTYSTEISSGMKGFCPEERVLDKLAIRLEISSTQNMKKFLENLQNTHINLPYLNTDMTYDLSTVL